MNAFIKGFIKGAQINPAIGAATTGIPQSGGFTAGPRVPGMRGPIMPTRPFTPSAAITMPPVTAAKMASCVAGKKLKKALKKKAQATITGFKPQQPGYKGTVVQDVPKPSGGLAPVKTIATRQK